MKKDYLTVFSGDIARAMLKKGYVISDLKRDKLDPAGKRSIYIFKNEPGLRAEIAEYKRIHNEEDDV